MLGEVLEAPDNGFNALRLIAASSVVVSHSFAMVIGTNTAQPLAGAAYDLGANAVNVFFVLSGLMLSRSYERNPDWRSFAAARLLRIFPALLVAGLLVGWVIAPLESGRPLAAYFGDLHALFYPVISLLFFSSAHVPMAFPGSPFPDDMNLPLWTVKYELLVYAVFGVVSVVGLLRSRFTAMVVCVLLGIALVVTATHPEVEPGPVASMVRFGFCFMLGVTFYRFRDMIALRPMAAALVVAAALPLGFSPLGATAWAVATGYAGLTLASLRIPGLTRFTNRWDISFGIYIYGWPVEQALMNVEGIRTSLPLHLGLSLVITMALALLSYVLIERPAMRQRKWLAARIWPRSSRGTTPPATTPPDGAARPVPAPATRTAN